MRKEKNGLIIINEDWSNIVTISDKKTGTIIMEEEFSDAIVARYFYKKL